MIRVVMAWYCKAMICYGKVRFGAVMLSDGEVKLYEVMLCNGGV
jgi:hypothetical protein